MTVLKTNVINLKEVSAPERLMAINPERVVFVELNKHDCLTIWFDCVVTLQNERFIRVNGDFDDLVERLTTPDGEWDVE